MSDLLSTRYFSSNCQKSEEPGWMITLSRAHFITEAVWIWKGDDSSVERPHIHAHDGVITFFGSDFENPNSVPIFIGFVLKPTILEGDSFILSR
jgi:hypothetical protein